MEVFGERKVTLTNISKLIDMLAPKLCKLCKDCIFKKTLQVCGKKIIGINRGTWWWNEVRKTLLQKRYKALYKHRSKDNLTT